MKISLKMVKKYKYKRHHFIHILDCCQISLLFNILSKQLKKVVLIVLLSIKTLEWEIKLIRIFQM